MPPFGGGLGPAGGVEAGAELASGRPGGEPSRVGVVPLLKSSFSCMMGEVEGEEATNSLVLYFLSLLLRCTA